MIDLKKLTIKKAQDGLRNKEFTSLELTNAYIEEIKKTNENINAYLEIFEDAIDQAKKADEIISKGESKTLTGVPLAIKDNLLFKDHKAGASSKILEGYFSTYDAKVIETLKEEGAVIIGRTNMDEFAMGSSTETSAYGITKNPKAPHTVAGGSSGGSAATVAGDMALFSLGSDTGGSIRQPAGFCGIVGLKPTYGTISRSGLMAMGSSLDIIGPFTKSVEDAEIVFNTLAKEDAKDSTCVLEKDRICEKKEVKKIGVPRSFLKGEGINKETLENFEKSLDKLRGLGYEIVDIDIPLMEYSLAVYYVLMPAEVSTNLSRFDGIRYGLSISGKDVAESYKKTKEAGFGKEAKRRILLGTYVLSHGYYDAYYNKAVKLRHKITEEMKKVFNEVDLIATPTTPSPAFAPGAKASPLEMYLSDIFTVPANITGVPAISIPAGNSSEGLPLDIQFMAPHFGEKLLFEVGKKFEVK
ncbi:MAG: aspartyl-tRNA(Asn)/glutamyl-tRNA(Gln) amidotransferase subunit [Patescibacteria group bacterium]|jgi:aspartyl-tRNA(Asn)/glutamyl-tRNA(Gln) amidotransferase subunit A|nr:aspartyl-tRNA(Asn)/glutamyl-tRNA(Gln) amidotransferase subunit [Patescibacteria group bacterium]